MKIPLFLRGPYVVARHEFLVNLKSVRLIVMIVALALVVVGGAYGFGGGLGRGGTTTLTPVKAWSHPAISSAQEHIAVVWVSDPFGAPLSDRAVRFYVRSPSGTEETLGEPRSDGDGFVRFAVDNHTSVDFEVRSGTFSFGGGVFWVGRPLENFTINTWMDDLDSDGLNDDLGVHVVTRDGSAASARIYINDTFATSTDSRGYGRTVVSLGPSNLTVEVNGENQTTQVYAREGFVPPFSTGPDFVLLIIAGGFATFLLPMFAITVAFDAISKERVQGTLDLLLSRPVSRVGSILGKLAGTFASVALPVTVVNGVGIGVLTAVSGKPPTSTFAAAFMGLAILLIAYYVLLQVVFSTLAKTSGTAILFGVLVWLAFNVLYYVITLVLSSVLFPTNFEGRFRFLQLSVLGNPSQIYQQLIAFAAPGQLGSGFGQFGGTSLDLPIVALAAALWLALLLALALWTFHRKAVE